MVPLPDATANVTATFATGLPTPSRTSTDGGEPTAVPTVADCVVGLLLTIVAAGPALSVTPDVAGVRPSAAKPGGWRPAAPVPVTPLKLAAPPASAVAVALLGVAPAGAAVAVTVTPLPLTGLPLASATCTTGCCAKVRPL